VLWEWGLARFRAAEKKVVVCHMEKQETVMSEAGRMSFGRFDRAFRDARRLAIVPPFADWRVWARQTGTYVCWDASAHQLYQLVSTDQAQAELRQVGSTLMPFMVKYMGHIRALRRSWVMDYYETMATSISNPSGAYREVLDEVVARESGCRTILEIEDPSEILQVLGHVDAITVPVSVWVTTEEAKVAGTALGLERMKVVVPRIAINTSGGMLDVEVSSAPRVSSPWSLGIAARRSLGTALGAVVGLGLLGSLSSLTLPTSVDMRAGGVKSHGQIVTGLSVHFSESGDARRWRHGGIMLGVTEIRHLAFTLAPVR